MSTPFFSANEVLNLRSVAESALATNVTIQHRTITQNAYGDDIVSYVTGDSAKGWLRSTPTPTQVEDYGGLVTANTYRLFLPVGTDVSPGDQVLISGETFVVSDTTFESTWKVLLRCSLRRRE